MPRGSEVWLAYSDLSPGNTNGTLNLDSATFRPRFARSSDAARSWTSAETPRFPGIDTLFAIPFGRIWARENGEMLLSIYTGARPASRCDTWRPVIVSSRDGETWTIRGQLPNGFNETALLPIRGDTLIAVSRSGGNYLTTSVSTDAGATWTAPTAVTGTHEVGADAVVMPNGEILLVYGRRFAPKGIYYRKLDLHGITVHASVPRPIVAMPDATLDLGYPSVASIAADGTVRAVYYQSMDDMPATTQLRVATFCPT